MTNTKRILIAPLNWGLGHASRCIPVIDEFLKQGCEVALASDGRALALLKKEYPQLKVFDLPPYNVHYKGEQLLVSMMRQGPKISRAIYKEHQTIKKIIEKEKIDLIVSDNRFGCYHEHVKSIFITHQLVLQLPIIIGKVVNKINQQLIAKFDECWVPDLEGPDNLSGILSHGTALKKIHFIGVLSRMEKYDAKKKYDVGIVLSGPEPQRTFLEEKMIDQARRLPLQFLLGKGKTEKNRHYFECENIEVHSFLTSKDLNEAMLASEVVVSRSGYSTIMDLAYLQKKAILIPTPGQSEQEYLSNYFEEKNIFLSQSQTDLNLKQGLQQMDRYTGFTKKRSNQLLAQKIRSILK